MWVQLVQAGEDGPFLAAVLDLVAAVAGAVPALLAGLRSEVASLLAEDDPQLAVAAARMLAAAGAAMRAHSPGALSASSRLRGGGSEMKCPGSSTCVLLMC